MSNVSRLVEDRTDLDSADRELLLRLVEEWSVLADLALSDLVLWVPTWNEGGLVAVAHVRPSTAPTLVPQDVIGEYIPRGREPRVDQALAFGRAVLDRDADRPLVARGTEAFPVPHGGRIIGVIARHASSAPRVSERLEQIYLSSADDLFSMIVEGAFPPAVEDGHVGLSPRVGDGLIRLSAVGIVEYASPNAITAVRRLGLAPELVGSSLAEVVARLSHRPGAIAATLSAVAGGRVAGGVEVENPSAVVVLQGIPLERAGHHTGALVFCRDVTDLRGRERALLSKDATIREIHHRVKNNLQTVAAMLRMQGRRASSDEAREALAEAELRVAAIAIVHESLSGDISESVDFDAIIDRIIGLVRDLAPAYAGEGSIPVLVREGSWGSLPADTATPLAMAASELLHNAVEHARATRVVVRLTDDESLKLEVHDDGVGLPEGFDLDQAGLGLSIVQTLATSDLHGTCSVGAPPEGRGTSVTISVPKA